MAAPAAFGIPQPQSAADLRSGLGDVLSSIRRMIAEDEQGGAPPAPAASPLPLRLDAPILRLDSPVGGSPAPALPPLRLGRGDSPEATRLRAAALREAIRSRVPGADNVTPDAAPVAEAAAAAPPVIEAPAAETATPVLQPSPAPMVSLPEPRVAEAALPPPLATPTEAALTEPHVEAPAPGPPVANPAAGFFGEMIREVLRQELRGDSLERMSGDLRTMVLREVARAITGGPAEGVGR